MTAATELHSQPEAPQLDAHTLEQFASVTRDLQSAFDRLASRASVVEEQLAATNRRLAAKVAELDELHEDLAVLLEALPCGVLVRDAEGRIMARNPAASTLLDCKPGKEMVVLEELCSPGREGEEPFAGRISFQAQDGRRRLLSLSRAELPARSDNTPRGEVLLLDDLTEHDELVRAVASRNKMAAIGTLSAGLAHEIRNPLNAVVGFASLLAKSDHQNDKERHWAKQILAGALETNRILTGLVDFARPGELEQHRIETLGLLRESRELVLGPALAASDHRVELLCLSPWMVGDRLKLRQALRNLIQNALDASGDNARVRVTARSTPDGTVLSVEDDGPGVEESARESLFEPFYTGRASGTGLGLALTHAIAELHGGRLRCLPERSEFGGAHFELLLPQESATFTARAATSALPLVAPFDNSPQ